MDLPEQPEPEPASEASTGSAEPAPARFLELNRNQLRWACLDLERSIGADHPARAIWELVGRLDLQEFEAECLSREGQAGRPGWPPRVLISVWIYAYSQGIASARALERMLSWEPGLRWLAADEVINYHTLSSFRVEQQGRLDGLSVKVLGLLQSEDLLDLGTILTDGTKVRARAGKESMHRRKTLEEHCAEARKVVQEMEQQQEQEAADERRQTARERAAREKLERMEAAIQELGRREKAAAEAEREKLRVSESEAEARKMKHADGSWSPSYNVQVQTELQSRMVVGIEVTQAACDAEQLVGGLETVERNTGVQPAQMVADGGYVSRQNVEELTQRGVELIAPWQDADERSVGPRKRQGIEEEFRAGLFTPEPDRDALRCPQGRCLEFVKIREHHEVMCKVYEAAWEVCQSCACRPQCCPTKKERGRRVERVIESEAVQAFERRMQGEAAQRIYKRRSEVAEFPHMWWKGIWKWRRFSVRGLARAGQEALWVALSYNVQQWIRLRWQPRLAVV